MAGQTVPGGETKTKTGTRESFYKESGKLAACQTLRRGPVSAVLMSEISNESTLPWKRGCMQTCSLLEHATFTGRISVSDKPSTESNKVIN